MDLLGGRRCSDLSSMLSASNAINLFRFHINNMAIFTSLLSNVDSLVYPGPLELFYN